ncbi:MAG TPA: hypothetical protein VEY30_03930 [Myxococcaceae bacterium]|nr:hypothetical protein [Myxococcaceae bacterium]
MDPGVTTQREVLISFGEPTQKITGRGRTQLIYTRAAAPSGTEKVVFRIDPRTRRVDRIDVVPRRPPSRTYAEDNFGPACSQVSGPDTPCYEIKGAGTAQAFWAYRSIGVVVFLRPDGRTVRSWSYLSTAAPGTATPAEPSSPEVTAPTLPDPPKPGAAMPTGPPPSDFENAFEGGLEGATVTEPPEASEGAPLDAKEDGPNPFGQQVLTLGGTFFQRAELNASRVRAGGTRYQPVFPALLDLVLDLNPSTHTRGYVVGRLTFDPAVLSTPAGILDQLWFQFDLAQSAFVTFGRQRIKWGSSKIWNPTDFLQTPNRRPLDTFDLRTGVDMVKLHVPLEELAANFYAIGLLDLVDPATQEIDYTGALRAEWVLGLSEMSLSAAFTERRRPRYGADISVGVGRFDLHGEFALTQDAVTALWRRSGDEYVLREKNGLKLQTSGGLTSDFRVADIYQLTLRLEGFYNGLGYTDAGDLAWLYSTGDYLPLYFGRTYAAIQVSLARRSNFFPSATFTTLSNVTDRSSLWRLDAGFTPVAEVAVRAFFEVPTGTAGGEFRFAPEGPLGTPPIGSPLYRAGLNVTFRM